MGQFLFEFWQVEFCAVDGLTFFKGKEGFGRGENDVKVEDFADFGSDFDD
jgi:hypothetical protein